MMKWLLLPTMIVFLSFHVLANGLFITNPQGGNLQVNKTQGQSLSVDITIQNQEPFTFQNITFEQNPHISMSPITSLASGQNLTFTASIIGNSDFEGPIRIKGLFQSLTGGSAPVNTPISVTFNPTTNTYDLSQCDLTISEEDSITWTNNAQAQLQITSFPSTIPISGGQIGQGQSFTRDFPNPEVFQYYFTIFGTAVSPVCTITVLEDSGIVNDPNLDAILNLNLEVLEDPTTLQLNSPITSYTVPHNSNHEGAVFLTNTGSNQAVNVRLSDNLGWMSFSPNNFNIVPGQTRVVTYTISPLILNTNGTDKNYNLQMQVIGNFPTLEQNLTVFIPFANVITNTGNFSSGTPIEQLILEICSRPEIDCEPQNQGQNSTIIIDPKIDPNVTQSQWLNFITTTAISQQEATTSFNFLKEGISNLSQAVNSLDSRTGPLEEGFNSLAEEFVQTRESLWTIVVVMFAVIIIGVASYIIYTRKNNDLKTGFGGYNG